MRIFNWIIYIFLSFLSVRDVILEVSPFYKVQLTFFSLLFNNFEYTLQGIWGKCKLRQIGKFDLCSSINYICWDGIDIFLFIFYWKTSWGRWGFLPQWHTLLRTSAAILTKCPTNGGIGHCWRQKLNPRLSSEVLVSCHLIPYQLKSTPIGILIIYRTLNFSRQHGVL